MNKIIIVLFLSIALVGCSSASAIKSGDIEIQKIENRNYIYNLISEKIQLETNKIKKQNLLNLNKEVLQHRYLTEQEKNSYIKEMENVCR